MNLICSKDPGKVIIVEGIIAAGKSVLSQELSDALGGIIFTEPDEKGDVNPYLADYYKDAERWSYPMQTHLLGLRYQIHQYAQWHCLSTGGYAVIDRSLPGDVSFAHVQRRMGLMTEKEFNTYRQLYHIMLEGVHLPNICVRLLVNPETSLRRIQKRMRDETGGTCETSVDLGYLKMLDEEITHMVQVLNKQGVVILDVPWDVDRDTKEDREESIRALVSRIEGVCIADPFLDIHRRTV
jgi:deoxyadenosine/deoxycytidine kinase